jgi:hypothetical protein
LTSGPAIAELGGWDRRDQYAWVPFVEDWCSGPSSMLHPTCFADTKGVETLVAVVHERDHKLRHARLTAGSCVPTPCVGPCRPSPYKGDRPARLANRVVTSLRARLAPLLPSSAEAGRHRVGTVPGVGGGQDVVFVS